jgi:hypothetical protein
VSLATVIAVTVPVTRGHLTFGRPGDCRRCAIALAIADAIPDAVAARVYYTSRPDQPADARADVTLAGGGTLILALGPDVTRIMARIDKREPVGPFAFAAEVLDQFTERELAA